MNIQFGKIFKFSPDATRKINFTSDHSETMRQLADRYIPTHDYTYISKATKDTPSYLLTEQDEKAYQTFERTHRLEEANSNNDMEAFIKEQREKGSEYIYIA